MTKPNWRELADVEAFTGAGSMGLITDVDGTISPIVDTPSAAHVTERARALLAELVGVLPLVGVISGRAAVDVRDRVGVAGMVYAGNHGMERWQDNALVIPPAVSAYRPNLEAAIAQIEPQIEGIKGMWLEDKGATLSLHYRQADDHDGILQRFRGVMGEIEAAHDLRTFEGRMIFEIRPPLELNKGTAFTALVREYGLSAAIYIGDDTTDIDAINAARVLREDGICYAVGVGVQSAETPPAVIDAADYLADGIPDVEAFFAWVLESRRD